VSGGMGGAGYSVSTSNSASSGASKGDTSVSFGAKFGDNGISNNTIMVLAALVVLAFVMFLFFSKK